MEEKLAKPSYPLIEKLNALSAQKATHMLAENFSNRIVQLSSLSIEDQIITHMLLDYKNSVKFATIDTGRLPQETFSTITETMQQFNCQFDIISPNAEDVEHFVSKNGPNGFYNSLEARKACCFARKVQPLKRLLSQYDVWITGQRQEHSLTRLNLKMVEWDEQFNMIKFNPLYDWTEKQAWDYIKEHNIPYSKLYDQGYTSIGCAPCTRATKPGESIRAGRWWWEEPEHKECGLHNRPKKITNETITQ